MAKLVFGCGYLGRRVAQRWVDAGETVFAVTRHADHARQLGESGITPLIGDITQPETLPELPVADGVLFAVGYDRSSRRSIREVYVQGLQHVLARLSPEVQRFVYVSSTGVYGQTDGQWVDESSECLPRREGGRACLSAERLLLEHPMGRRAIILRCAGLYGPQRVPRLAALQAGESVPCPDGWLNLIHVEDAAAIAVAAQRQADPPRLYVVSDGQPVLRREYYREVARLIGAPPPNFVTPPADSAVARRAGTDKRIRATRMQQELSVTLQYPSYREGLRAVLGKHAAT